MAWIVSALTDHGAGQVDERGFGMSCPGLEGGGEDQGAAVEDVLAALTDDERVERCDGSSLARQGEDVGGGALTGPVPGWQAGHRGQPGRGVGVVPGEPLVEQAEGKAGAGGDGWDGAVRGFRLGLVQDSRGEPGIAVSDGLGGRRPNRGQFR